MSAQSQSKDIINKVTRQIKNDGTFGNLIKKAVSELEEEGFIDFLREDGKKHSDAIFKRYFPETNKVVDMNKDLKEAIIRETRCYVNRPQLQTAITNKIEKRFKIDWFKTDALTHKIEDLVRKELGLPLLYEEKEVKEEPCSEETQENTALEPETERTPATNDETNDDNIAKEEDEMDISQLNMEEPEEDEALMEPDETEADRREEDNEDMMEIERPESENEEEIDDAQSISAKTDDSSSTESTSTSSSSSSSDSSSTSHATKSTATSHKSPSLTETAINTTS